MIRLKVIKNKNTAPYLPWLMTDAATFFINIKNKTKLVPTPKTLKEESQILHKHLS